MNKPCDYRRVYFFTRGQRCYQAPEGRIFLTSYVYYANKIFNYMKK